MPRSAADLVDAARRGARAWALRPDADEQEILRLAGTRGGAERDAALVLWAAGALRRRYHGGPWAWDLLHDGLPVTAREQLRDRVQRGLRSLGRTAVVGKVGQQLWLSTLIAEAGLPGALLGKPDGPVHLWCRGVLSDLQRFGLNGDAEEHAELAVDRARLRAPRHAAWVRDEGVAELVGLLCLEVRRLHPAGGGELPPGEGPEVVAWLDQLDPDWRQRLPIDLSDGDAVGMVRALLGDIAAEARRPDNLRVRAELWGPGPDGAFGLERRVMVPGTLTEKQLRDLFALPEEVILPPRLTMRVVGGERLALLLKAGECWEAHCGPDVAPAGAGTVRLELLGAPGGARVAVGLPGSDALPEDRPWVFGASGPGGRALLVALGPVRSRDPALRVALPAGARVVAGQAGRVGKLSGRLVLEVEGPVTLRLEDGEEVALVPRHDGREDEPGALVVRGPRHPWSPPEVDVLNADPGQLRVLWMSQSGSVTLPPHDQLWHRPQGGCSASQPWVKGLPTRSGRWRLRWSRGERRDDALLWLLLPTQDVQLADLGADGGRLVPVGDPAPILSLGAPIQGVLNLADRGALRLTLHPGGRPPGWLRVQLNLPHGVGHELPLEVPFPARRAGVLQRSGAWAAEAIALELLAGCRAQALDPGAKAAWIELRGPGGGGLPDSTVRLPGLGPAWSLDLEALRADVARRLAHHPSPDAAVELRVTTDAPTALRSEPVKVQRYTRRVVVGEHADLRLEPPAAAETLRAITLQAHRLDAIAAPVALPRLHPGARWAQQPELRGGWWLVVARDEAEEVARPALLSPPAGEEEASGEGAGPLRAAVACAGMDRRRPQIEARLQTLGGIAWRSLDAPALADLELVRHHLDLLDLTSAASLDVVRALAAAPVLAARLAVDDDLDEVSFDRRWTALEDLPFLWALVPHAAWKRVWDELQEQIGLSTAPRQRRLQAALDRCLDRLPSLRPLVEQWSGDAVLPRSGAAAQLQFLAKGHVEGLLRRGAEGEWATLPRGQTLQDILGVRVPVQCGPVHPAHRTPVLQAPWAAAAFARQGATPTAAQVDELRRLRDFDPTWFDEGLFLATAQLAHDLPEVTL